MKGADPQRTLIDDLLSQQGQLTAVEKFSRLHEREQLPAQQKFYRDLIPLTLPKTGEQFAFEVNLDSCSGCKACVTACHSLNGLDENETWRAVGKMIGGTERKPYQQTITTACHHCVEPGCLEGCPVDAYEKDFTTGIVRHLDDQCIGCQYCLWMCPYEVPQYSKKRGIVRKCDMCSSRLTVGEAPACVQACPNGAIAIRIVNKSDRIASAISTTLLPDAPDSRLTIPGTIYTSKNPLPKDLRASRSELRPEHAHAPLIFTLVLTQMAVGIFLGNFFSEALMIASRASSKWNAVVATSVTIVGLLASAFHLGRPSQGWRAFLGWKHSWLSREVIAFGVFGGAAVMASAAQFLPVTIPPTLLSAGASVIGLAAIFCSAMVYHATRRDFWLLNFTATKFFGAAVLLGAAASWLLAVIADAPHARFLAIATMVATVLKLGWEISFSRQLETDEITTPLQRSASLMFGRLRHATSARILFGLFGGVFLPFLYLVQPTSLLIPASALAFCIAGELLERFLFFTAVAPQKMPGTH